MARAHRFSSARCPSKNTKMHAYARFLFFSLLTPAPSPHLFPSLTALVFNLHLYSFLWSLPSLLNRAGQSSFWIELSWLCKYTSDRFSFFLPVFVPFLSVSLLFFLHFSAQLPMIALPLRLRCTSNLLLIAGIDTKNIEKRGARILELALVSKNSCG